jgi:hypothetical protein
LKRRLDFSNFFLKPTLFSPEFEDRLHRGRRFQHGSTSCRPTPPQPSSAKPRPAVATSPPTTDRRWGFWLAGLVESWTNFLPSHPHFWLACRGLARTLDIVAEAGEPRFSASSFPAQGTTDTCGRLVRRTPGFDTQTGRAASHRDTGKAATPSFSASDLRPAAVMN